MGLPGHFYRSDWTKQMADTSAPSGAHGARTGFFRGRFLCAALLSLPLLLTACRQHDLNATAPAPVTPADVAPLDLAIVGYNYTDREIDHFTVDGVGGGNVGLSGVSGGGGGIACCARFQPGPAPSRHVVKWNSASCRYNEILPAKPNNEVFELHYFHKEVPVSVNAPASGKPGYFEVHFMRDGSIKTQITAELSAPMVSLPDGRKSTPSPQCPGNVAPSRK